MGAVQVPPGIRQLSRGEEIRVRRPPPEEFRQAMNRDCLIPRSAGRYVFGRLIGREDGKLHLLPLGAGQRQMVVANPPWLAAAVKLVRSL